LKKIITSLLIAVLSAWSAAEAASSFQSELDAVLRRKPDLEAGEKKYVAACSACHGVAGEGQPEGRAPRIAGQRYTVIASQLVGFRRGRRQDDRMQERTSEHVLTGSQDFADVAAYAAQLPGGTAGHGPGNLPEAGAQLFASRCKTCHGTQAEGSEKSAVPRLAAQNYSYLLRQLRDFIEGRRPAAGRDHLQQLQRLDSDQITGLADYLSRLP
jgi:cytochrome c553